MRRKNSNLKCLSKIMAAQNVFNEVGFINIWLASILIIWKRISYNHIFGIKTCPKTLTISCVTKCLMPIMTLMFR